jgi:hypothetical protein
MSNKYWEIFRRHLYNVFFKRNFVKNYKISILLLILSKIKTMFSFIGHLFNKVKDLKIMSTALH